MGWVENLILKLLFYCLNNGCDMRTSLVLNGQRRSIIKERRGWVHLAGQILHMLFSGWCTNIGDSHEILSCLHRQHRVWFADKISCGYSAKGSIWNLWQRSLDIMPWYVPASCVPDMCLFMCWHQIPCDEKKTCSYFDYIIYYNQDLRVDGFEF